MCSTDRPRCGWATGPLLAPYHDAEWGVPLHDERGLFETLCLEGAQAGLSWAIVLRKREGYRALFAGFDPAVVAGFGAAEIAAIAADPAVVRHRGKVASVVTNARAFLALQAAHGSFDAWLWGFTDGVSVATGRAPGEPAAATSALSDRVSKALRGAGFSFVGSTIVQAYLQAVGVLDDHDAGCYRRQAVAARTRASKP